jgi:opacity protein-like surface antigen
MKKVILFFALALATATGVYAQKQTGGEKNLEVQFAPLGGSPVSISGIRMRMFNSESSAIRIGLFLGGTTDKEISAQPGTAGGDPDAPELVNTDKTFSVSLRPGYEKHFAGTDRLSPYVGAELLFTLSRETSIEEAWSTNSFTDPDARVLWETTTKDGSTTFGVNLVAGTDFYFADNIYLGAELGFGFASTSEADTETEVSDTDAFRIANGIPQDDDVEFDPVLNGSSSGWGPNFQGTIRLGWLFN